MIVQCPSCSTKFSIDSQKVVAVSNPKFHCSRCDCYFDLQTKGAKAKSSLGKPAAKDSSERIFGEKAPVEQLGLLEGAASIPPTPERYERTTAVESHDPGFDPAFDASFETEHEEHFPVEIGLSEHTSGRANIGSERVVEQTQPANSQSGRTGIGSADWASERVSEFVRETKARPDLTAPLVAKWPDAIAATPFEADLSDFRSGDIRTAAARSSLASKGSSAVTNVRFDEFMSDGPPLSDKITGVPRSPARETSAFREKAEQWTLGESARGSEPSLSNRAQSSRVSADTASSQDSAAAPTDSNFAVRHAGRFQPIIEKKTALIGDDEPRKLHVDTEPFFVAEAPKREPVLNEFERSPAPVLDFHAKLGVSARARVEKEGSSGNALRATAKKSLAPLAKWFSLASIRTSRADAINQSMESGSADAASTERFRNFKSSSKEFFGGLSSLQVLVPLLAPVALTGGFWVWSHNFSLTPGAISALARVSREDLPRLSPPGLEVVGVQNELISLDDGSKVVQVKGTLVNATQKNYRDVLVETRLYDSENRTLASVIVPANNGLSGVSEVSALRASKIDDIQSEEGALRQVRASQQLPFKMVVAKLPAEASYFSTRIYSVKSSS